MKNFQNGKSLNVVEIKKKKKVYQNVMSQIKQFVTTVMPQSVTMLFAKKVAELDKCKCSDNTPLFMKIASCFAKEMLNDLKEFKNAINVLNKGE